MSELRGTGVEFYTSHTVKEATGSAGEIESVVLVEIDDACEPVAGTEKAVSADTVCLAIGLVPNVELLGLLGCDLSFASERGGWAPVHDDRMRTSVESVFVAGDVAGFHDGMVLDPEIARNQGRLAGLAAAESLGAIDEDEALARSKRPPAAGARRRARRRALGLAAMASIPRQRRWAECLCVPMRGGHARRDHRLAASALSGAGV